MTKRVVKEKEYQFLKRELQFLEESEVLPSGRANEIQDLYEVEEGLSFTRTLLYVGAILIGAGILSFIASNWGEIGKLTKFLFILGMFISSNLAGYKMESNYPKTSKSFYYLGTLVYGAGIFLIGQMFHFGGDFQDAFLWWSLGILPLAWVLKDKWILMAASFFVLIYMSNGIFWASNSIPYWILLWMIAIHLLNEKIGFSKITGFITGVISLVFIGTILNFFIQGQDGMFYIYGLIYLTIGIALVLTKVKLRNVYVILGYLVHGAAAFALSFGEIWPADWMYIPFSIVYIMFLFYLIHKGSLFSIILLCVMIFRFYLDISFAFLPKSFVFIIGGLLLLGFGFYFENKRKKGGGMS
ncbi:DUF2157 domain-containing protein [Bacillus sp. CGMCC 1.16607]|uniref:DUF2157 domain-containing protein n=1 Tax=Bacillus sp. CGMCC 1.16607 TaxID=3351842 RepID=UPI00363C1DE4